MLVLYESIPLGAERTRLIKPNDPSAYFKQLWASRYRINRFFGGGRPFFVVRVSKYINIIIVGKRSAAMFACKYAVWALVFVKRVTFGKSRLNILIKPIICHVPAGWVIRMMKWADACRVSYFITITVTSTIKIYAASSNKTIGFRVAH